MTAKRATLADVARAAGLSPTTASQILNGTPNGRFSDDSRRRVQAAAAALNYRPNMGARALRTDKSLTIGFVSDVVATTRFASGLIRGAVEAAQQAGHVMLVVESGGDRAREAEAVAAVLDRQVDGIIFATMQARRIETPAVPEGTRVVMLNATTEPHRTSVLPDERAGGRRAVDLLAEAGHRDGIALIGRNLDSERDPSRSATVGQRTDGILGRLTELGIRLAAEKRSSEWELEDGYRLTRELLEERTDVRALICMNDRLSFGAYRACQEHGLEVGRDISVVSFDDDEIASYLQPPLTTIALPYQAMGRRAVDLILGDEEAGGQVLISMPAIVRSSIAPQTG